MSRMFNFDSGPTVQTLLQGCRPSLTEQIIHSDPPTYSIFQNGAIVDGTAGPASNQVVAQEKGRISVSRETVCGTDGALCSQMGG